MNLGIANDHGGYELKIKLLEYFKSKNYNVIDYGSDSLERVDYPDYGFKLGEAIKNKEIDYGIAICKSAIGISVACNKVDGVRCGKINNIEEAIHGKTMDYLNCIAISGYLNIEEAVNLCEAFLNSVHDNDPRYYQRVEKIISYEKSN